VEIGSIGSSGHTARNFFSRLEEFKATSLIDTRIHPNSQLAGFATRNSLEFFCEEISHSKYVYEGLLSPTPELLKAYRKEEITWEIYVDRYSELLSSRDLPANLNTESWGNFPVLLCSENKADFCHRRIAINVLKEFLPITKVTHL